MKVRCYVEQIMLPGDYEYVDSVEVNCTRCGNSQEVFGTSERSIKRGLVEMRESCRKSERNFYFTD